VGVNSLSASKTSVLIVDDDTSIRETLRYLLEDAGYAVFEAQDGLQALDHLRKAPAPMIVLLDLMMPRVDGAGLLGTVAGDTRRLRRHRYIMMTAGHQTLSLAFAHLLSDLSVPVIHKPFNIDKLLDTIASHKPPST
jgi:two-component system, NtrC family, nitrogen regulation response regulator NtrX